MPSLFLPDPEMQKALTRVFDLAHQLLDRYSDCECTHEGACDDHKALDMVEPLTTYAAETA